jgi:hypothetical protein
LTHLYVYLSRQDALMLVIIVGFLVQQLRVVEYASE